MINSLDLPLKASHHHFLTIDETQYLITNKKVKEAIQKLGPFEFDDENGKSHLNYSQIPVTKLETGEIFIREKNQHESKMCRGLQITTDQTVFEGSWNGNQLAGKHRIVYPDGTYFEGSHTINGHHDPNRIECSQKDSQGYACKFTGKARFKVGDKEVIFEGQLNEGFMQVSRKPKKVNKKILRPDGSVVEGATIDDQPLRNGSRSYINGSKYTGDFDQDYLLHGRGTYIRYDGEAWYGAWEHGKILNGVHIKADEFKYTGTFEYFQRSGSGTCLYLNGETYNGEWENDKQHGHGSKVFSDGWKYDGKFFEGKISGPGKWTYPVGEDIHIQGDSTTIAYENGDCYHGMTLKGLRQGKGELRYATGAIYTGSWYNDKMNGHGLFIDEKHLVYEGQFVKGEFCGQGVCKWNNGDKYTGEFRFFMKNGYGVFEYADGSKYEGIYKEDLEEGYGVMTWSDGRKYEGWWKEGKFDGKGTLNSAEGVIETGKWRDGERVVTAGIRSQ